MNGRNGHRELTEAMLKTALNMKGLKQTLQTTQIKFDLNDGINLCDWVKTSATGKKRRKLCLPRFTSFPTMFSNAFCIGVVKTFDCVVKGKLFTINSRVLTTQRKKAWENTEGKGINAGNHDFLLFPQCFLLYQREKFSFYQHSI